VGILRAGRDACTYTVENSALMNVEEKV